VWGGGKGRPLHTQRNRNKCGRYPKNQKEKGYARRIPYKKKRRGKGKKRYHHHHFYNEKIGSARGYKGKTRAMKEKNLGKDYQVKQGGNRVKRGEGDSRCKQRRLLTDSLAGKNALPGKKKTRVPWRKKFVYYFGKGRGAGGGAWGRTVRRGEKGGKRGKNVTIKRGEGPGQAEERTVSESVEEKKGGNPICEGKKKGGLAEGQKGFLYELQYGNRNTRRGIPVSPTGRGEGRGLSHRDTKEKKINTLGGGKGKKILAAGKNSREESDGH